MAYSHNRATIMKEKAKLGDIRNFDLDTWQKRVLNHKGNIALRCGRQTGKSTIVSLKARKLAYDFEGSTTLILASSLRQSQLLYEKVRNMLEADNLQVIKEKLGDTTFSSQMRKNEAYRKAGIFLDKEPTKTRIRLKNGSQIICEPCGQTGNKIRGFTVDFMIVDEAQLVPDAVWVAIIPMMLTSKNMRKTGWTIVLGTPAGKRGYYYDCFKDKAFKPFHITSEESRRKDTNFLRRERARLTKAQYQQEYLAEFVEGINQYFESSLIENCIVKDENVFKDLIGKRFLGVDFARYGGDENAYVEAVIDNKGVVNIVFAKSEDGGNTMDSMGFIKSKDNERNYNRIFIDSGGLGGSILDVLQETIGKRKVIGINNSQKRFQEEGEEKKTGILKEDLYINIKILMEQGKINIINNPKLIRGLKNITFRYSTETGRKHIFGLGDGSHIVEALVRACWGIKNKGLDIVYIV